MAEPNENQLSAEEAAAKLEQMADEEKNKQTGQDGLMKSLTVLTTQIQSLLDQNKGEADNKFTDELLKSISADPATVERIVDLSGYNNPLNAMEEGLQKSITESETIFNEVLASQEMNHNVFVGLAKSLMYQNLSLIGAVSDLSNTVSDLQKSLTKPESEEKQEGQQQNADIQKSFNPIDDPALAFGDGQTADNKMTQMMGLDPSAAPEEPADLMKSFTREEGYAVLEKSLGSNRTLLSHAKADLTSLHGNNFERFFNAQHQGVQRMIQPHITTTKN